MKKDEDCVSVLAMKWMDKQAMTLFTTLHNTIMIHKHAGWVMFQQE